MSLSSLQCTTSDLKFELYAFRFTQASWALRRAAVGSSDRGIKAVTNGAQQSKHKYGSTARTRLYISEASRHIRGRMVTSQWFVVTDFRTSAECVLCLQDLSCLENLPSSLKIRIMQTRQTPTRMTVLLPMSVRLPRRS